MTYQKWTEEDDKKRNLFDKGEYRCTVLSISAPKKTQGGFDKDNNPKPIYDMVEVDFVVEDMNGAQRKMRDWVMLNGPMSWKFRHLADACGLLDRYENDSLKFQDILGRHPILKVDQKEGKDKDNNPVKRNVVLDYLKSASAKPSAQTSDFQDDEIKF